jgi:SPP1 family predicted phage head-tail adaptor
MRGGLLRNRLTIQQETRADDGAGGSTTSWADIGSVWARVAGVGGREFYEAKRLNPEISHQVELRYRSDIQGGMRLLWDSRVLRVESAIDPDGERRRLLCNCKELLQ